MPPNKMLITPDATVNNRISRKISSLDVNKKNIRKITSMIFDANVWKMVASRISCSPLKHSARSDSKASVIIHNDAIPIIGNIVGV